MLTESFPTNFHTFASRVILKDASEAERYQEVTASQRAAFEKADALWVRPPQYFIDLWNEACINYYREGWSETLGKYNEETGYFELNGLIDITYEQALAIFQASANVISATNINSLFKNNMSIRTNFPIRGMASAINYPFYYCSNIEIARCDNMNLTGGFFGCKKVHSILNVSDINNAISNTFECAALVNFTCLKVSTPSLILSKCPLLSLDSFKNIVDKAAAALKTITVHPDVYAKVTDEGNAEWNQLLKDAALKNISFASA